MQLDSPRSNLSSGVRGGTTQPNQAAVNQFVGQFNGFQRLVNNPAINIDVPEFANSKQNIEAQQEIASLNLQQAIRLAQLQKQALEANKIQTQTNAIASGVSDTPRPTSSGGPFKDIFGGTQPIIVTQGFYAKEPGSLNKSIAGKQHGAVDLRARTPKPLYSPGSGRVTNIQPKWGAITITFDNGTKIQLGHLSKINYKVGDRINENDLVGYSGNAGAEYGYSTAPHLHVAAYTKNGSLFDPQAFLQGKAGNPFSSGGRGGGPIDKSNNLLDLVNSFGTLNGYDIAKEVAGQFNISPYTKIGLIKTRLPQIKESIRNLI